MDFEDIGYYFTTDGFMRKKRLADWREKISAAFVVRSVLADKAILPVIAVSLLFFGLSMWLTGTGE